MKVAFISLTGCEGCLYNVINEDLFNLLEKYNAELVDWRLLGIRKSDEYDVAVVEGSVVSDENAERLKLIREKSKVLIALGACATLGGVQAGLYGENNKPRSTPLHQHVKVDYFVRGCPVKTSEFLSLLELILKGVKPRVYERRFSLVERPVFKISDRDNFLQLDSSKCIVCGRCIEVCKTMKASVLNYVNRGITTLVSTPYQDPFDKTNCHYCGLCVAYCPAGAITYKLEPERLRRNKGAEIYIEPEALASLAEAENLDVGRVFAALRLLGYSRIIVYSNTTHVQPGRIYAKSPVEYQILRRTYPNLSVELLVPRIPINAIYVTQCTAWRKQLGNSVTTRELQLLIRSIPRDILEEERENQLSVNLDSSVHVVSDLREVEKAMNKELDHAVVYSACPGGCLMGGGQPLSLGDNALHAVYERRAEILNKYLRSR